MTPAPDAPHPEVTEEMLTEWEGSARFSSLWFRNPMRALIAEVRRLRYDFLRVSDDLGTATQALADTEHERDTAEARATALQAENERLKAEHTVTDEHGIRRGVQFREGEWHLEEGQEFAPSGTQTAEDAAEAENERLRGALEPFAAADRAIGDEPGPFRFETGTGHRVIERDDFLRARAALAQEPDRGSAV